MSLIFADDGEGGSGTFPWTETNSSVHQTPGKDGSYTVLQSGSVFYAKKVFGATYTELFFSCFFKFANDISVRLLSWYHTGGTVELGSVRWNATSHKFELYTGTTLQVTGSAIQQAESGGGTWFNLNIRVLLHASTGVIDIRHEGATVSDAIFNGNTLPSGSNMDAVQLFTNSVSHNAWADNFWVNDTSGSLNNSWPGVMRASTQFPTGKSATNDAWTADSGTNKYDRINEQPASGANFIYSETTGNKQGFTYAAPSFTGIIKALTIQDLAQKISSGGIKQGIRFGGTDYPSSTKTIKTTYTRESMFQHILEQDPSGPDAWTTADNPETYLEKTA